MEWYNIIITIIGGIGGVTNYEKLDCNKCKPE